MNQRPARKTQFKPNRRRRLFKWLTIILIFLALGCTAGLLIPGLNRSRNASVKLSSPLKIVQKVVSNGSSSTDSNTQLQEAWKPILQQADGHVAIAVYSNQTKKPTRHPTLQIIHIAWPAQSRSQFWSVS